MNDVLQFTRKILANPFYAINIHPALHFEHEPIISEEQWIATATRVIAEEGSETFLRTLLDALKDPVLGEDDEVYGPEGDDDGEDFDDLRA